MGDSGTTLPLARAAGEEKDPGLGLDLDDPVRPLSFTLSMEHSKPVTGEGSEHCFGQENQRFALTTAQDLCLEGDSHVGLGNEEGEDVAETGKGKGKFVF